MGDQLTCFPVSLTWLSRLFKPQSWGQVVVKEANVVTTSAHTQEETIAVCLLWPMIFTWCHDAGGGGTSGQIEKNCGCSLCTGTA